MTSNVDPEVGGVIEQMAKDIYEKAIKEREARPIEIKSKKELVEFISKGLSIVVFYNPTCPACKRYLPVYEGFIQKKSGSYRGIRFGRISTKDVQGISSEYMVIAVPTTIAFKDGKEVKRTEGYMDEKELEDFIRSLPMS
ncbi:MAG: thioredoxin domain-containing protein [Desulfurococcales archaeon]|jgi:thioredoxin 1|nr:thioredoxin domain-containing protein [Desulfurococcales archaeon]